MISSVVFVDAVVGPATGSTKAAPRFAPGAPVLKRAQISPRVNLVLAVSFGPAGGVSCPSITPGAVKRTDPARSTTDIHFVLFNRFSFGPAYLRCSGTGSPRSRGPPACATLRSDFVSAMFPPRSSS